MARINRKAQTNLVGLYMTLIIVGALSMVSVLVHSKLSASITPSIPVETNLVANESTSVTVLYDPTGGSNSTLLSGKRFITGSEVIRNSTDHTKALVRDTDYSVALVNGASGEANTQANITLLDLQYNASTLKTTYSVRITSESDAALASVKGNTLDSFELGSTGMIILAVSVIIAIIGGLGVVFSRR